MTLLREWAGKAIEGDHALVSTLWRSDMQSHLAGQLFVQDIEFGTRKVALAPDIYDRAFVDLDFPEALDYFESREILSPEDFRALLDDERIRAWSLSRGISETVVRDAAERIRKAMEGDGSQMSDFIDELASGIDAEGYPGGVRRYLEMVFRTTNATSYNAGRLTQQTDPDVAAAFADGGWLYLTADDTRVRRTHAALEGKQWRYDDPEARRAYPPNGFNCFSGQTVVSGDVLWVSRARYAGDMVELRTDSGRVLTVTENHPLLTTTGFKAACEIAEGEDLLTDPGHVEGSLAHGADVQDSPARIDDLWNALRVRNGSVKLRICPEDLHGDAVGTDGEVEVVAVNRELLDYIKSHGAHGAEKRVLVKSTSRLPDEVGDGGAALLSSGLLPATGGTPGGAALALDGATVFLESRPLDPLGLGPSAGATVSANAADNRLAGHAESLTQTQHALTGLEQPSNLLPVDIVAHPIRLGGHTSGHQRLANALVSDAKVPSDFHDAHPGIAKPDRVVSVKIFPSSRHVYDLQTVSGMLAANGIYASNCRCVAILIDPEDMDPAALARVVDVEAAITPGFVKPPTETIADEAQ